MNWAGDVVRAYHMLMSFRNIVILSAVVVRTTRTILEAQVNNRQQYLEIISATCSQPHVSTPSQNNYYHHLTDSLLEDSCATQPTQFPKLEHRNSLLPCS